MIVKLKGTRYVWDLIIPAIPTPPTMMMKMMMKMINMIKTEKNKKKIDFAEDYVSLTLWVKMSKAPNKMKSVANDLKPT
jgi:hypothetical protein